MSALSSFQTVLVLRPWVLNSFVVESQQQCDSVIYDILAEAEAQDYASHFARHRISWEMLKTMTDQELKEVSEATK